MANNDLNQVRIFSQVAQLQSFSKAAEQLGVEKSTVSLKIAQLEERLGIRLLNRTTRSVGLTEAGAHYLKFCQQALLAVEQGDDYISALSDEPSGRLKVNMHYDLCSFILDSVLSDFLKNYPKVQMELSHSESPVDLINGDVDVDIQIYGKPIQDSSLVYRKMYSANWTVVASPEFVQMHGPLATIEQFQQAPCIGPTEVQANAIGLDSINYQGQNIEFNYRLSLGSANAVKQAVLNNLGFALLPTRMVSHELKQGLLQEVAQDLALELPTSTMYAVYPTRLGQPATVRQFLNALADWGELASGK